MSAAPLVAGQLRYFISFTNNDAVGVPVLSHLTLVQMWVSVG